MGKHLKHGKSIIGSENNDHQPGCISGMLHALDYHQRGNKHQRKHRSICCRNPRTYSLEHETTEEQPFLDAKKGVSTMLSIVEKSKRQTKMKKMISKDFSLEQGKEYVDILEILNANKEVFIKILKDPDLGFGKQFHIKGNPGRLDKSESFPMSGSSKAPSLKPITTLEHKEREYWAARKGSSLVLTFGVQRLSSAVGQKTSFREPEDHGFSYMVMHGFKEIKKWLKKALEVRKDRKKQSRNSLQEKGISENDLRSKMKHTNSLNDSLDRYSQLFKQSFRRDIKFHSMSLRLVNEDNTSALGGNQPMFFRRISSLSGLESFGSFLTELSCDGSSSSTFQKNTTHETESRKSEDLRERQRASECTKDAPMEIDFTESIVPSEKEEGSISSTENCSSDKTASTTETLFSEELSTKPEIHDHYQHYNAEEDQEAEPYFCYLKKVLELSGFLPNNEKWHSKDQSMDPSLNFKLNPQVHEELDNNKLLLDLITEVLNHTCNESHIYFPKAFSFIRRIYPFPKGKHLLDEVWGRFQWSLFCLWTKKEDCSLDDFVAGDLAKADGWMDLQVESEWIALKIEDLILDEILDELVCDC